jgi:hypothetical protein
MHYRLAKQNTTELYPKQLEHTCLCPVSLRAPLMLFSPIRLHIQSASLL